MKKWKPKCGETFYYVSLSGTISSTRAGIGRDTIFKIATNNCFKTYAMCKKVLKTKLDSLGLNYFKWGKVELPERPSDCFIIPDSYKPEFR